MIKNVNRENGETGKIKAGMGIISLLHFKQLTKNNYKLTIPNIISIFKSNSNLNNSHNKKTFYLK
jgi:hypothetical protein